MKLTRDPNTGKILDGGKPVVLRGGQYALFAKGNKVWRGFAPRDTEPEAPFPVTYTGAPCVRNNPQSCPSPAHRVRVMNWTGDGKWDALFQTLAATGCNVLRIWVMGGTAIHPSGANEDPYDEYPFLAAKQGGVWKWRVFDAFENNQWNETFFTRLALFAEKADRKGVCVQLTLFNYFDFDDTDGPLFKAWSASAWNPAMTIDPTDKPNWSENHLVKPADNSQPARNHAFIVATPNLREIQKKFIRKLVPTLRDRGNIIFEVMNEPRQASAEELSRFNSEMVGAIAAAVRDANAEPGAPGNWKPLVSVNASMRPAAEEFEFDTDWWRAHSDASAPGRVENFELVDAISYHGLTGYDTYKGVSACNNKTFAVPRTDPTHIRKRVNEQKRLQANKPDKKAVILSTDAARIKNLEHNYCDDSHPAQLVSMEVHDGQIETGMVLDTGLRNAAPESETERDPNRGQIAIKSALVNWAYWTFKVALEADNLGLVHFQNHSAFEFAFQKISAAWTEANKPTA